MKKISLLFVFIFISLYSFATTIVVTNTLDAGAGSLRASVAAAAANDTIRFSPSLISAGSVTINLNTTITANNNITIKGLYNSQDTLFISGQNTIRLFNFYGTSVNLDSLVLVKGRSTTGGCISISTFGTTSYLTNSVLRGNVATQKGGAIHFNNGSFYILNSSITNNTATSDGGAIYYQIGGNLTIEKCIISNNATTAGSAMGGAILIDGSNTANFEIYRSVLNNNTCNSDGGAIMYKGRYMTVDSCTFKNNTAGGLRKGIIAVDLRNATPKIQSTISGCTIANNTGCGIVSNVSLNNSTPSESKVYVSYCSIHHNTGGGIYSYCSSPDANAQSLVDVSHSTVAYNGNASGPNGGIYSESFVLNTSYASSSNVYVKNSTVVYNTSGGNGCGVFSYGKNSASSYVGPKSSIIGYNTGGLNILSYMPSSYNIQSQGFNIFSESVPYAAGTDQTGVTVANVNLGGLGNNGGYGQTMMPLPGSYALNAGTITDMTLAQNGPVQGGRRDIGAAEFIQCVTQGSSITQSACGSYVWNAQTYTTSGVYTRTVSNANGCDSTITLNLTINQPSSRSLTQSACDSYVLNAQTYTLSGVYTQTLTNSKGCDSLLTLNLTINQPSSASITHTSCNSYMANSQTYTASGVYTQTLTNSKGCDSLLTLNLTINQPSNASITHTACNNYLINSQTYTASGVYTQTLSNSVGCDSILTINLTINTINASITTNGLVLTANESGASYQWIDCNNNNQPISGANSQSYTVTANGNYAVEIVKNSCTSTSACTAISSVGMHEASSANVRVFPNPGNGVVFLENLERVASVTVVDVLGKELVNTQTHSPSIDLNLSEYGNGVYFLKLQFKDNSVSVQRILIEK